MSALLARLMAQPKEVAVHHNVHGTDITLVGNDRSYLPITRFSIEQSDGVTSISQYLRERTIREFEIKRSIEVIPNFVNCDLYKRCDDQGARKQWAKNGRTDPDAPFELPPGKAHHGRRRDIALLREKIPAKLVMMGDGPDRGAANTSYARSIFRKMCSSWASRTASRKNWA